MMNHIPVKWSRILRLSISLLILMYVFWAVGPTAILHPIYDIDIHMFLLAVLILAMVIGVFAGRWWMILYKIGLPIRFNAALESYFASELINQAVPGGIAGEIYRGFHYRQYSLPRLISSIALDRLYGVIALLIFAGICFFPLGMHHMSDKIHVIWPIFVILSLIGGGIALLILHGRKEHWFNALTNLGLHRLTIHDHVIAFLMSVIGLISILSAFGVIAIGVGMTWDPFFIIQAGLTMMLASLLPISFGDWGIREGVLAGIWVLTGQPAGQAVAIGILFGIANAIAATPGIIHFIKNRPGD